MARRKKNGIIRYRNFLIIKRNYETAAVFQNGHCLESGFPSIQAARKWIEEKV